MPPSLALTYPHTPHTHTVAQIVRLNWLGVCVCVCVCYRDEHRTESEREREPEGELGEKTPTRSDYGACAQSLGETGKIITCG